MTAPGPEGLRLVARALAEGAMVPFLGPELVTFDGPSPLPATSLELAKLLNKRSAVPGRIRNNPWAVAQYIESNRHRQTLVKLVVEAFAPKVAPSRLHLWLAGLKPPLVVDTWYDDASAQALTQAYGADGGQGGWGLVQGVNRHDGDLDTWFRHYTPDGGEVTAASAAGWKTVLYKPMGGVWPARAFLLSDSDLVEVLTEIDIQTPIPPSVIELRRDRGFLFLGCRFHDQLQRIFARQIIKRSAGPHVAVVAGELSRNESRFLELEGIERWDMSTTEAFEALAAV